MPTYEYECKECGVVVDVFQSITDRPLRKLRKADAKGCDCDAPVRRRIGSGGGIIFKGSGFYQTDYRSESYKKGAEADKKAKEDKGKKSDGDGKKSDGAKTESKPAKKPSTPD